MLNRLFALPRPIPLIRTFPRTAKCAADNDPGPWTRRTRPTTGARPRLGKPNAGQDQERLSPNGLEGYLCALRPGKESPQTGRRRDSGRGFTASARIPVVLASALLLVASATAIHAQTGREIDIGAVIARGGTPTIRVSIESDDADVAGLARRAFAAHGQYRVTEDTEAVFRLSFSPGETGGITLVISSGRPRQEQFRENFRHTSQSKATLLAIDAAIRKTSGLPGIFASQIAFVSDRSGHLEIYTGDPLFAETRQVTRDRSESVSPNFSPDGTRIIYTGFFRNGFPDLYQINLATGKRESFVSFQGTNTGGVFSPDGQRVAVSLSGVGNAELYTTNPEGREMVRLTEAPSLETDPEWSPDGRELIFTSDHLGRPQIYRISAQGGSMRRVPTNISGYCAEPAWNPRNPSLIAFTAAQGAEFEIALHNLDSGETAILTQGAGDAVEATWMADGRHLIYTRRTAGQRRLLLLDTETGRSTPLHSTNFGNAANADYIPVLR